MARISFIGSGNMGGALITAACKSISPDLVMVTDCDEAKARALCEQKGCRFAASNSEAVQNSDVVLLCVKPQVLPAVLEELAPVLRACTEQGQQKTLVSIAAGVTIQSIRQAVGLAQEQFPIIRLLPNTPAAVGQGLILMAAEPEASQKPLQELRQLLRESGSFAQVEESQINAAGVLGGCAPAFVYLFIEAMADGGVLTGLPRQQAQQFAAQAVLGAAAMVLESGKHPGQLKDEVCSPGGSTIVGVKALEDGAFRSAAVNAVMQAYEKTIQLGRAK